MPWHRASFATSQMSQDRAPNTLLKPLKQFDGWAVQNCPPVSLKRAYGAMAPQRTFRLTYEQF